MSTKLAIATTIGFWILLAIYAGARVFQILPGKLPMVGVVALHVVPLLLFALIHGAIGYRLSGIFGFIAICLIVGNIFENVGVATGFPFGRYHFTDAMGPKILNVPVLLGLAYVGMGYLSWSVGRVIAGVESDLAGFHVVTLPLVASLIMVAWDFANDPVWANINHLWIWHDGGPYFGVPLTNFLGWYLVIYVIYQLFAIWCRGPILINASLPRNYWRWAIVFYASSAAGNVIILLPTSYPDVVLDSAGVAWGVRSIATACALVSIFVMGAFVAVAWARLTSQLRNPRAS